MRTIDGQESRKHIRREETVEPACFPAAEVRVPKDVRGETFESRLRAMTNDETDQQVCGVEAEVSWADLLVIDEDYAVRLWCRDQVERMDVADHCSAWQLEQRCYIEQPSNLRTAFALPPQKAPVGANGVQRLLVAKPAERAVDVCADDGTKLAGCEAAVGRRALAPCGKFISKRRQGQILEPLVTDVIGGGTRHKLHHRKTEAEIMQARKERRWSLDEERIDVQLRVCLMGSMDRIAHLENDVAPCAVNAACHDFGVTSPLDDTQPLDIELLSLDHSVVRVRVQRGFVYEAAPRPADEFSVKPRSHGDHCGYECRDNFVERPGPRKGSRLAGPGAALTKSRWQGRREVVPS
jgi:hypothetical protein